MRFPVSLKREDIRGFISRSWSVSWPLTLVMLFDVLIGWTDIYVAGKISKEIQAAYGVVIQIYFILIVVANSLTIGTVSVVSRLYTSKENGQLNQACFSSFVTGGIAGAVLALAGFLYSPHLIRFLDIPEPLKPYAILLIKIYALGLFFHYLLINSNGILRSCQRIKRTLRTMAIVCIINIALNLFLVFETSLGFRGIALATAISVFIGSMLNLASIRNLFRGAGRISLTFIKRMFDVGWPAGLLQVLWQLSSIVLYLILSKLPEYRIETLAALTAGLRIESVIYLPVFGFNMANAVIVGNLLGEKKEEDAFRSGLVTMLLGVGIVTLMVIIVILNARWIASFLSKDPMVVRECMKYIYISMISEPFMAWGVILGGGLSGAGDTRSLMIRVGMSVWLVRIPLAYIFVVLLGYGAVSVWWCMNISQLVQAILISHRYFSKKWLSRNVDIGMQTVK